MAPFLLLACSLSAFLAAAKAHGRQVRLERELAGIFSVVFGGRNPEAVESIWRSDRLIFWPALACFLVAAGGYGWMTMRQGGKPPFASPEGSGGWIGIPLAFLGSFIGAFFLAGMASALRTFLAAQGETARDAEWHSRALWGSLAWWTLVLLLVGGLAILARRSAVP